MNGLDGSFTLVRIADLAGKDVAGLVADLRTRNADGSLKYEHTEVEGPRIKTLKRVEYRTKKAGPTLAREYGKDRVRWLYWYFDPATFSCDYSGQCAENGAHLDNFLMVKLGGRAL